MRFYFTHKEMELFAPNHRAPVGFKTKLVGSMPMLLTTMLTSTPVSQQHFILFFYKSWGIMYD